MDDHYFTPEWADFHEIRVACGETKSISFVSHNFNVVHPGHLGLLKFAAEPADVLVVGINSDEATGVTLPQDMRLENVRSISIVDYAVGLDGPADTFIVALKPNVVVKGREFETRFNAEQEYVTCDAVGMPREDPTLVVTPIVSKTFVGGAGGVAAHARGLGADVRYCTIVGEDEFAKIVLDSLEEQGVRCDHFADGTRPTTRKQRFQALNPAARSTPPEEWDFAFKQSGYTGDHEFIFLNDIRRAPLSCRLARGMQRAIVN